MSLQATIKILIADDHSIVRQSFVRALEDENNLKVTGQAGNGLELINLMETQTPDIVIMDLEMPVMNGYDAIKILLKKFPGIKIICLSMHYEEVLVHQLLKDGVRAYLVKNCNLDDLILAVNSVHLTGEYIPGQKEASHTVGKNFEGPDSSSQHFLSEREIAVLKQICMGRSNKQIAALLYVSINTVDFHKKNIRKKTNLYSNADLINYAIRSGFKSFN